jgi:hypothetical protein
MRRELRLVIACGFVLGCSRPPEQPQVCLVDPEPSRVAILVPKDKLRLRKSDNIRSFDVLVQVDVPQKGLPPDFLTVSVRQGRTIMGSFAGKAEPREPGAPFLFKAVADRPRWPGRYTVVAECCNNLYRPAKIPCGPLKLEVLRVHSPEIPIELR